MNKETKLLLIIFLIAFLVRAAFVFNPVKIGWDEAVYDGLGYDLSNGLGYTFENKWSDYVPGGWPNAGYRAPLLPCIISLFYFLNISFLLQFLMPLIGALTVIVLYFLIKEMFNENLAKYAALLLALTPLHIYQSTMLLTEVLSTFFVTVSMLLFWRGFEKNDKRSKLLFGLTMALAVVSRYTAAALFPVFVLYFLLRDKNVNFVKDKYLWGSGAVFTLALIPMFLYGMSAYRDLFGAFMHGLTAASYWGGVQPIYFFLQNSIDSFSAVAVLFLISIYYIAKSKKIENSTLLLLLWFAIFFLFVSITPHKEDRFILLTAPAIAGIAAISFEKLKHSKKVLIATVLLLLISISGLFIFSYTFAQDPDTRCYLEANEYLAGLENNSVIITEDSPITYHYTKLETHFYPHEMNLENFTSLEWYYKNRPMYILYAGNEDAKPILEDNFEEIFSCENIAIYKY